MEVWFFEPLACRPMLGKKLPSCASVFSSATRNDACAAAIEGFAASACLISASSGLDWNKVHHSPGISCAWTNFCAVPSGPEAACVPSSGAGEYPAPAGAAGWWKLGPTAQPESTASAGSAARFKTDFMER